MNKPKHSPGFSLLEMLVSLSIGSFLLAALYQISIQLDFSLEQKKADVVSEIATLTEYKSLQTLFDNAGLFTEKGNPIASGNNNEIVITYKGKSNCFARATDEEEDGSHFIKVPIESGKGIHCLTESNDKGNESNLIIEDAEKLSIHYHLSAAGNNSWVSSVSNSEVSQVKGIYFRYSTKEGKTYGLFSAFNTRN